MKLFLVRHANASRSSGGPSDDSQRALSDEGRDQARGLAESFDGDRIVRILSSPYPRCVETVQPLAERHGLEVEIVPSLGEGNSAETVVELLRSIGDLAVVLCSHGDVIPDLLGTLEPRLTSPADRLRCRTGSTWVLEGDLDGVLDASYRPPPPTRTAPGS